MLKFLSSSGRAITVVERNWEINDISALIYECAIVKVNISSAMLHYYSDIIDAMWRKEALALQTQNMKAAEETVSQRVPSLDKD